MSFTGILGTSDAYPGNIVLGVVPVTSTTYDDSVTLACTSNISSVYTTVQNVSMTLETSSDLDAFVGQVYTYFVPLDSTSNLTILPGSGYSESVSFDGTSSFDVVDELFKDCVLSLEAEADISLLDAYVAISNLTFSTTASCTPSAIFDTNLEYSLTATSEIYIESLYEFLYEATSSSTISVESTLIPMSSYNPSASGSFSVSSDVTFSRTLSDSLTLVSAFSAKRSAVVQSESVTLVDSYSAIKYITTSWSDTLTFDSLHDCSREISDTLVFTSEFDAVRVKVASLSDVLAFTSNYTTQATLNRTLSDSIVFEEREIELPINGIPYIAPEWDGLLVSRKCVVILASRTKTIVLPCPVFGDSQTPQHQLSLKRTMTGGTYAYVRRSRTQKLSYTFELWTHKYLELESFFHDNAATFFTLLNHRTERWYVAFANNPIEFNNDERYQPKGEKFTVTLELEGIQLQ